MAGDDVTITIRASNGDAVRAFRDTEGRLRSMSGRFVSESAVMTGAMNRVASSSDKVSASASKMRGSLIPLAAAALPVAAAFAPIAAKAGGASLAVAAFGIAAAGQASSLKAASDAQKKYEEAVTKSGRGSKQAAEAQRAAAAELAGMPVATQRAAIGFQTLRGEYEAFSDRTARFTMAPVEKSFTVLGEILPRLEPMVEGTGTQLDRLMTVAGGAVSSPGFDAYAERVSTFANESLATAVTGVISFSQALAAGSADGPVAAFMEYMQENGPAVRDTLASVGDAAVTLIEGAADAGPGMLTLVNAAAELVAALPPELVTVLMQTAVGLKAVSLASAAVTAVTSARAVSNLSGFVRAAQFGGVGSAIQGVAQRMTLLQKVGGSLAVLGVAALAIDSLADKARGAPPDVDKLTDSLKELSASGRWSGELKNTFGDMDGFVDKLGRMKTESDGLEKAKPFLAFTGLGSFADTAVTKIDDLVRGTESLGATKDDFKSFDESFSAMAKAGYGDQAAQQFEAFKKAALDGGMSLEDFNSAFSGYLSTTAGLKAEQDLAAQSMGVFGQAAQDTSAKLEAQKGAADGLRASVLALNDVNRSAYDAQIGFEASLDSLTESFAKHGATLNLDTEAGRANATAMSAAAKSQDELIASGLAAGESLGSMVGKSEELRESMMRLATDAFDGNKAKATEYVNTLLGVPSEVKTMIKAEKEEAISGLHDVQSAIEATPGAKSIKVATLNGAAIAALEAVGLKTKQLKDGKTAVYTANGQSLGSIGAVTRALRALNGKTARTFTTHTIRTINEIITKSKTYRSVHDIVGRAGGGRLPRYADGDQVQFAPEGLLRGPGTGTSDDILAIFASGAVGAVSDTEFVVNAKETKKHLPLLEAINDGRLPKFAKGGVTKSEREARNAARGDLTISHFGQIAGYKNSEIRNDLGSPDSLGALVSSLNSWRSSIMKSTHGSQERSLLRQLDSYGKTLIKHERALATVNKSLDKAKDKLDSLKDSASQLSSSVKSGILGEANITKAAGAEDSQVTINTLLSNMTASAANSKQFSSMLSQLQKKGLSGDLISQIGEANIAGGGMETAAAILGGGSSEIKRLNDLQKQITSSAGSAGKTTADAMYGAAIKSQESLVKALTKQQDKLEKAMDKLARAMEKSIEKAYGKKAAGGIIGAASGGIRSSRTWVGENGPELLDLPPGARVWSNPDSQRMAQPAWASMLNAPRGGRAGGSRAGVGGMQPVVVHQTITLDGRVVAQQVFDPFRKEIANRGGNVQDVLGRRQG